MVTDAGVGLNAAGDPTRRAILELLAEGPVPVRELAESLPVTRSAVSQHLRVLKTAGLVRDRAVGTRRVYELDPIGMSALHDYFDQFWGHSLASLETAARHESTVPSEGFTDQRSNATEKE